MPKKKTAAKAAPKKKTSKPPATETAPAAAAALPPGETATIDLAALHASPLNPRKAFNDDTVAELAESIAANGILQNLVVRRRPRGGFEIIAGERRFRALTLLAEAGRWDRAAAVIPVRIVDGDEAAVRAMALLENLQREDISPMEEAEAFAALHAIDPDAWSTAAIAQRIGKTQRHVQKRMELVEKLDPKVQEALRAREINLEQAKAFALGDPKLQIEILRVVKKGGDWRTAPHAIRRAMTDKMVPISVAFFEPTLYTGEIVENEDEGERYFADVAQFNRLQDAAIEAKLEALKAKWPWAKLLGTNDTAYDYSPAKKGDKNAGAFIHITFDGKVQVKENVLKPRSAADERAGAKGKAASTGKKKKAPKPEDLKWLTRAQVEAIKATKTLAMRRAVTADPKAALCLAILGLTAGGEVAIRGDGGAVTRYTRANEPMFDEAGRERLFEPITAVVPKSKGNDIIDADGAAHLQSESEAAIFKALLALEIDQLQQILAAAVSQRVGSWVEYDGKPGDSPLAIAIAEATGASSQLDGLWEPSAEYFAAYRRDTLVALAGWTDHRENFNRLKKSEQVALLSKMPKGFWTHDRFAELQFLDDKGIQRAMAGPALTPAAAKQEIATLNAGMAASVKGRCRACQAHEGGKHHKRCAIGKAGEKKVSAESCTASEPPAQPFTRWWRVGGEPGVDEHAERIGRDLGYVDPDNVGLEFADGTTAKFLPHMLFPAEAPVEAAPIDGDVEPAQEAAQ